MAIDIKFTKFDNTPWGFRLTGGSEYGFPMTVVRVYEGSLCESLGLKEGDILVALNEQGLVGASHDLVHDYITRAGNNFIATILRGSYEMEELEKFKARIEKQPLFPSSCLSQETINNNNSLTTTPTPLINGTFVNKVPSDQQTSSSPSPVVSQPLNIPSPTSFFKPVTKTYKPFTKDINTTLTPLEKPLLPKSPTVKLKDDTQILKQQEYLEIAKKIVPDICKYVDKNNIGRSTPTFVIENSRNSVSPVDGMETSSIFRVITKEYKSVKPPGVSENKCDDNINAKPPEVSENQIDANVNKVNGQCDGKEMININGTAKENIVINGMPKENIVINGMPKENIVINGLPKSTNSADSISVINLVTCNGAVNGINGEVCIQEKSKEMNSQDIEKKVSLAVSTNKVERIKERKNNIKDDIIINGGVLLDINEIEKSAKLEDKCKPREKIIEIVKESDSSKVEHNEKKEVRKSVKCMVDDYIRTTTPSPNMYKMSCKIRNPSVTPVNQEPVIIEEVKIIKEEIVHYSPVPKTPEPNQKTKLAEKSYYIKDPGDLNGKTCKSKTPCPSPLVFSKEVHELSNTDLSLDEAKINAISAASVLSHEAKQRNYKIPCVSANIPAQNQTDVLLKTFFIHLTDVMVALTKMITNNECCHCGRVVQDCTHKSMDLRQQSETVSNLVKEISEKVSNTQTFDKTNIKSEKSTEKVTVEKPVRKIIASRNEAVQTEALKEVFQNTSMLGVDVTVNGKDPLLWLADLDEKKIVKTEKRQSSEFEQVQVQKENTTCASSTEIKTESQKISGEAKIVVDEISSIAFKNVNTENIEKIKSDSTKVETKEENVVVQEVGENEYSVSLSRPKAEKVDVATIEKVDVVTIENANVETNEQFSSDVKKTIEMESQKIEESSIHVEESTNTVVNKESIEFVEEVIQEPIKKIKKPKKKKMMKVVAKDPLTPNTDEFFFRLDVKLDGLRTKTPDPSNEHEDLSIVKKSDQPTDDSQTIAEKKSNLKLDLRNKPDEVFVLVCQPSSEDSTPNGEEITKKTALIINKENEEAIRSESISIKSAKADVEVLEDSSENTNATASCTNANACNILSNSTEFSNTNDTLNLSNVPKETIGTVTFESIPSIEQQSSQASAHVSSITQNNDESSKLATDSNSASLQSKELQISQNGFSKKSKADTKVTSLLSEVKMSTSEITTEKEEIRHEYQKNVNEINQHKEIKETISVNGTATGKYMGEKCIENQQNSVEVSKAINSQSNVVENSYLTKQDVVAMNGTSEETVIEQSAAQIMTKEANIGYATLDTSRVIVVNGVNGSSNGIGEDLGKAGLTDEEIADILSGEAEVLKDQHVIGLQKVLASHMNRPAENDDSSINFNKMMPVYGFLKDSEVFKALNEETIKSKAEMLEEQRKNTKFLQKPNRPIPFCKRLADLQSKEPAYKVDIRSQKKRDSLTNGSSILTEGVFLIPEVPILVPEPPPEVYVAPEYLADSAFPDLEDTGIPIPEKKPETPHPEESAEEPDVEGEKEVVEEQITEEEEGKEATEEEEMKDTQEPWKELVVDETIDESLPVEEQLLRVQKQLETLSRLPAAIQHTLDIVTKQLVKMVPRGDTPAPCGGTEEITKENGFHEEITEQTECTERVSEIIEKTENHTQVASESVSRCSSRNEDGRKSVQFMEDVEVREINSSSCGLSEHNSERDSQDFVDQQTIEHNNRQLKHRPTPQTGGPSAYKTTKQPAFGPLTPEARPIVLPGGRKWRGPKDAFTDAFIAETLTGQATVIQGKAIGSHSISNSDSRSSESVDFTKYNKPPISLDHIKDSPVYKLIHEMEDQPMQGVGNKPRAIAESEYRERCQSATPNHMENGGMF